MNTNDLQFKGEIPIQNIYYLLCYSWNKLDEQKRVDVSIAEHTSLVDLFAKVLANSCRILLKRGVDKNYLEEREEVVGVKGKLCFSETVKRNVLAQHKTICTTEYLSEETILNRILVTTLINLSKTQGISPAVRSEIIKLVRLLPRVQTFPISKKVFKNLRYTRNNSFYKFIMNVCELVYESSFPSEQKGSFEFTNFIRDEVKMRSVFEDFIRNFYKLEQTLYTTVKREIIRWKFSSSGDQGLNLVPQMQTDVTLTNETRKVILDAKYYLNVLSKNAYGGEKLRSDNLYQLFSYLVNQRAEDDRSTNATGILLYPTTNMVFNLDYRFDKHNIWIRTLDLNADWSKIHHRLLSIIQEVDH